jgi:hypothetical protein
MPNAYRFTSRRCKDILTSRWWEAVWRCSTGHTVDTVYFRPRYLQDAGQAWGQRRVVAPGERTGTDSDPGIGEDGWPGGAGKETANISPRRDHRRYRTRLAVRRYRHVCSGRLWPLPSAAAVVGTVAAGMVAIRAPAGAAVRLSASRRSVSRHQCSLRLLPSITRRPMDILATEWIGRFAGRATVPARPSPRPAGTHLRRVVRDAPSPFALAVWPVCRAPCVQPADQ